jgi:hypothetical protein
MDELVAEGLSTRSSIEGISLNVSATGYSVVAPGPGGPVRIERAFSVQEAVVAPSPSPTPTPKK